MTKDVSLSLKISAELSKRIDLAVSLSGGSIRDRNELGILAIEFFLDYNSVKESQRIQVKIADT
ncbi:MAG: hypothetical protein ACXAD7_06330 [Candidatus Kariarchaeaceae archaeon]|jgi:hypothetical protein